LRASPKGSRKSLVCSQKAGRKGPNAIRRSLRSRSKKKNTVGICRQQVRSTHTDWQNAPTQHQLGSVIDI